MSNIILSIAEQLEEATFFVNLHGDLVNYIEQHGLFLPELLTLQRNVIFSMKKRIELGFFDPNVGWDKENTRYYSSAKGNMIECIQILFYLQTGTIIDCHSSIFLNKTCGIDVFYDKGDKFILAIQCKTCPDNYTKGGYLYCCKDWVKQYHYLTQAERIEYGLGDRRIYKRITAIDLTNHILYTICVDELRHLFLKYRISEKTQHVGIHHSDFIKHGQMYRFNKDFKFTRIYAL